MRWCSSAGRHQVAAHLAAGQLHRLWLLFFCCFIPALGLLNKFDLGHCAQTWSFTCLPEGSNLLEAGLHRVRASPASSHIARRRGFYIGCLRLSILFAPYTRCCSILLRLTGGSPGLLYAHCLA